MELSHHKRTAAEFADSHTKTTSSDHSPYRPKVLWVDLNGAVCENDLNHLQVTIESQLVTADCTPIFPRSVDKLGDLSTFNQA